LRAPARWVLFALENIITGDDLRRLREAVVAAVDGEIRADRDTRTVYSQIFIRR